MMVVKNSLVNPNQASKLGEIVKENDDFTKMLDDMDKKNDEIKKINGKFTKELKEQDKIFKQFDLAFIRNQIIFGNLDEEEQSKLFKKSLKIAKELSEL